MPGESTLDGHLLTVIGALVSVIVYQHRRMENLVKREQDRADRMSAIIERAATTSAEDGKL